MGARSKIVSAAVILLVCAFAAYLNTFHSEFHFDDLHQIVENPHIRDISNLSRFFTDGSLGSGYEGVSIYRPLTQASFAINYLSSGLDPLGYHVFNFALHFLNSLLVFVIAGRLLKEPGRGGGGFFPPLIAALLFALHPVQTDAVTYVSGRAVLLGSFFYLLAFAGFVSFRSGSGRVRYLWAAAAPVFFLFGVFAKEIVFSLPLLCLAYDLIFTLPKSGRARPYNIWLYYLAFICAGLFYLLLRAAAQGGLKGAPSWDYGIWAYWLSQARVFLMYFRLLVFPFNQDVDYALPVTKSLDLTVAASFMLIALAIFTLYRVRDKRPGLAFSGFWFLIALLPESAFMPITDVAVEYRVYLPSAGFFLAFAFLLGGILPERRPRAISAACVIIVFGILTSHRNEVWATEYTLWRDAAAKSPGSARAYINLGVAFIKDGRYNEAVSELKKALATRSDDRKKDEYYINMNLGLCYYELGRMDEAIARFRDVVRERPDSPGSADAYDYLGSACFGLGRYREAADAYLGETRVSRGDSYGIRYKLAVIYSRLKMDVKARENARVALSLASDDAEREGAEKVLKALGQGGR